MEIRVKKAVGSNSKTATTLDLGIADLPEPIKARVRQDVGEYLKEQIISSAGQAKSPVTGAAFEPLSPTYKKKKKDEGLPGKPNLEFEGDLLDALDFQDTKDGIELGWFGDQAGKADGHNNLSGKSDLPERRLIPDAGESFTDRIQSGAEKIVADAIADAVDLKKRDLEEVTTKAELYETLGEFFDGLSRAEIKAVIHRAPHLVDLLDSMGLLDLL